MFTQQELDDFRKTQDWAKANKPKENGYISPHSIPAVRKPFRMKDAAKPHDKQIVEFIKGQIHIELGFKFEDYIKRSRKRELVECRQFLCYLVNKYTKISDKLIGGMIGRDRSTAIWARNNFEDLIDTEKRIKVIVRDIENRITERFF